MDIGDENAYGKDMAILWAAYKAKSFNLPEDWDQETFANAIINHICTYDSIWIVEDKNKAFPSGHGPVGVIQARVNGDILMPDIDYFKWATPRNILKTTVAFFQWIRYSKDVGTCVFGSTEKSHSLFDRMREYGIMVWHIGNGYFGLAGRKQCHPQ